LHELSKYLVNELEKRIKERKWICAIDPSEFSDAMRGFNIREEKIKEASNPLFNAGMLEALILLKQIVKDENLIKRIDKIIDGIIQYLNDVQGKDLGFYPYFYFLDPKIRITYDMVTTSGVFYYLSSYFYNTEKQDIFKDIARSSNILKNIGRMLNGILKIIDEIFTNNIDRSYITLFFDKELSEILSDASRENALKITKDTFNINTKEGILYLAHIIWMIIHGKSLLDTLDGILKEEFVKEAVKGLQLLESEDLSQQLSDKLESLIKMLMHRLLDKVRVKLQTERGENKLQFSEVFLVYPYGRMEKFLLCPFLARLLIKMYEDCLKVAYFTLEDRDDIYSLYLLLGIVARSMTKTYGERKKRKFRMFGAAGLEDKDALDISYLAYLLLKKYYDNFQAIESIFLGNPEKYFEVPEEKSKVVIGIFSEEGEDINTTVFEFRQDGTLRANYDTTIRFSPPPSFDQFLNELSKYEEENIEIARALRSGRGELGGKKELSQFFASTSKFRLSPQEIRLREFIESIVSNKKLSESKTSLILYFKERDFKSNIIPWEFIRYDGNKLQDQRGKALGEFLPIGRIFSGISLGRYRRKQDDLIRILLIKGKEEVEKEDLGEECPYCKAPGLEKEIKEVETILRKIKVRGFYVHIEKAYKGDELRDKIRKEWDIIHYAGHMLYHKERESSGILGIYLEGENSSERFYSVVDLFDDLKGNPPFIMFVNACDSASPPSLVKGKEYITNPAEFALKIGVAAYIGTWYAVQDDLAMKFAEVFYKSLLEKRETVGRSLVAAVRETTKIYNCIPEKVSYILYGDPDFKLLG
jgi:hypothetical protein